MKTLRFIRSILREFGEFALLGIASTVLMGSFVGALWCIGWVARWLGMTAPQGDSMQKTPNLDCGLFIFLLGVLIVISISGIIGAWRWMRNHWLSA